jgi:transcriptional regulator with XRE-family HTH domain
MKTLRRGSVSNSQPRRDWTSRSVDRTHCARTCSPARFSFVLRAHSGGYTVSARNWIEAERARCRRPITPDEVPGLVALGDELRRLRRDVAGLARPQLAVRAQISVRTVEQIELGIRRTRRSTLERVVGGLTGDVVGRGKKCDTLVERLVDLAGPALAPESHYRDRVERRRRRRWAKRYRRPATIRIDRREGP